MERTTINKKSFLSLLEKLLEECTQRDEIEIREVFSVLSQKGYATMLVLFSLPFCLPIQIPGFSTPFGIILGFIGLRIAFAKHPWWPQWILDKKIKSTSLESLVQKAIKIVLVLQKFSRPRLMAFTQNPLFWRMHGLLIFVLAILLSLPLPIPMTNMLAAMPILFIGFGLLENDGIAIAIAYCLALICFLAFFGIFYWGPSQILQILT